MHWLSHLLGLDDPGDAAYLAYSGVLGQLGLFATPVILLVRHNCPAPKCARMGRYRDAHGRYLCRRHHVEENP